MPNTQNVSTGKPNVGGALWIAPLGSKLPTTATEDLDKAFEDAGFISEDGLTNSNSPESEAIKAWGGVDVCAVHKSKDDTFQFTLLEGTNTTPLKLVYGKANVSGEISTGITIKANNNAQDEVIAVFDMILKGGVVKRIVIPDAFVSEVGDITYKDDEAIGYETTLKCLAADDEGNTHFEYIQAKGSN